MRELLQFATREHRSGGIGRMRKDEAIQARAFALDQIGCGLKSVFRSRSQVHRSDPDRRMFRYAG